MWHKLGLVYCPDGSQWWARQYAHIPTAYVLADRIRVYFAGLDENKYGRIGYVDLARDDPRQILAIAPEPVVDIGELGTFDDCGAVPSCIVPVKDQLYLYYIGFQRAERVPYMLFSGLATSQDGGTTFTKYSRVPILDRTPAEPFSRSAPFVLRNESGYRMWYWSCLQWHTTTTGVHYHNVVRYATSADGIQWQVHPHICITPDFPDEYSIGRPWVQHTTRGYRMWYARRGHTIPYSIGYAKSTDGIHWTRHDEEVGITNSANGWDAEMVCYPCVVTTDTHTYLFYNGNSHGRTGFGCAVWRDSSAD